MTRAAVYTAIATDGTLRSLGLPASNVFASQSVDTPPDQPFITLRWGSTFKGVHQEAPSTEQILDVWVNDQPADYSRIDSMIQRIKWIMAALAGVKTEVGYITCIEWTGDGTDDVDDAYGTIVRTTSYRVIASGR